MKRIITTIILIGISVAPLFSQSKEIKEVFEKYEKKKSVESVYVSPFLMGIAGGMTKNSQEKEWLSSIREIRILTISPSGHENNLSLVQQLRTDMDEVINRYQFEKALKVKDGEDEIEMYVIKESKGVILFLNNSPDEFSVIAMFGDISEKILKSVMKGGVNFN